MMEDLVDRLAGVQPELRDEPQAYRRAVIRMAAQELRERLADEIERLGQDREALLECLTSSVAEAVGIAMAADSKKGTLLRDEIRDVIAKVTKKEPD